MADHRKSTQGLIGYSLLVAAGLWLAYVLFMAFAMRDGLAPGIERPGLAAVVAALPDIWPMLLPVVALAAVGFWLVLRSGRRRDGSA